jgi:hypothetical protein
MAWTKIHATMWENKRTEETLAITRTGSGGILGAGYQRMYGWVLELYAKNPFDSQRIVFDTKAQALAEARRYMRKKR